MTNINNDYKNESIEEYRNRKIKEHLEKSDIGNMAIYVNGNDDLLRIVKEKEEKEITK